MATKMAYKWRIYSLTGTILQVELQNGSVLWTTTVEEDKRRGIINWLDVKHQLDIKQNLDTQNRRMKRMY